MLNLKFICIYFEMCDRYIILYLTMMIWWYVHTICPHDMSTRTKSSIEYSNNLCSQEISEEVSSDSFCWNTFILLFINYWFFYLLFLFQWKELARKYHLIHFAETYIYLYIFFILQFILPKHIHMHILVVLIDWLKWSRSP